MPACSSAAESHGADAKAAARGSKHDRCWFVRLAGIGACQEQATEFEGGAAGLVSTKGRQTRAVSFRRIRKCQRKLGRL